MFRSCWYECNECWRGFISARKKIDTWTRKRRNGLGWSSRRCVPHGGHQMALHVAAGLHLGGNESYPGVFLPFGGFADSTPVRNGEVELTDAPGIGIELNSDLHALFRMLL